MIKFILAFLLLTPSINALAAPRNIPLDTLQPSLQIATPSSPVSGTVFSYFLNADGFPYWKSSAGSVFGYLYSSSVLANHGVVLGNGTRSPSVLGPCSSNTLFVGNTGADPSCRQLVNADITTGTIDISTKVTGLLGLANGGTNKAIATAPGAVAYSDNDSLELTAVGTAKQFLGSNGVSAPAFTDITRTNAVFVDKSGSDSNCVANAINRPCLTITQAATLISAPATGNRWAIILGSGTYTEATLPIPPWTWITCSAGGYLQGGACRISVSSNQITIASGWAASGTRGGLLNVYLTGSTGVNVDFPSISSTGSHEFDINNVGMNGSLTFKSNSGTSDILDTMSIRVFTDIAISGGGMSMIDSQGYGNMTLDNSGSQNMALENFNSYIVGNVTLNQSGANTLVAELTDLRIDGTYSTSGTPTVTTPLGLYLAGVSSDWATQQYKVNTALDYIAARGIVKSQAQNLVMASPNGSSGLMSPRALVTADLPATVGDVSSNTSSSVDGEVALFSGTGGKTIKRATGSGLVKIASGVLGTATSGTDYAPATSGSSYLKGNGAGGFTNQSAPLPVADVTITTQALTICTTARTVDWSTGNSFTLTLTSGNACTLTFSNPTSGQTINLWLTNGSGGGTATVVWPTAKWFPAGAPVMTTGTAALDVCTCTYNGSAYACNCLQNGG